MDEMLSKRDDQIGQKDLELLQQQELSSQSLFEYYQQFEDQASTDKLSFCIEIQTIIQTYLQNRKLAELRKSWKEILSNSDLFKK